MYDSTKKVTDGHKMPSTFEDIIQFIKRTHNEYLNALKAVNMIFATNRAVQ